MYIYVSSFLDSLSSSQRNQFHCAYIFSIVRDVLVKGETSCYLNVRATMGLCSIGAGRRSELLGVMLGALCCIPLE